MLLLQASQVLRFGHEDGQERFGTEQGAEVGYLLL